MNKIKEYFEDLPFSFRSALAATLIVTALVTLQSYIWIGKWTNHTKEWHVNHFIFPVLNYTVWLGIAPFLYRILVKVTQSTKQDHLPHRKNFILFGLSLAFTLGHEVIGVTIYNAIYTIIRIDELVKGTISYDVSVNLLGFIKTYFEFWIIYFVLHGFHNKNKARLFKLKNTILEADLLKARMSALQNQLHPHFLFNAFNTISSLMEENTELAQRMISKLGALLRKILKDGDKPFITIKEEVELAKLYLEVEQIRFGGRLVTRFAIAPEAEMTMVPTLLLQPIIENAIKHGFYNKVGDCEISIKIYFVQGYLNIEIRDNGGGIKNASAFSFGIGLKNTKERLSKCYGKGYQLTIDPKFEHKWFCVAIKISEKAIENENISSYC